jgi:hypothetical protein
MSGWISNLRLAFESSPVLILHGNVRDWYVDENGVIHRNLTSLVNQLLFQITSDGTNSDAFDEILTYSGYTEQGSGQRVVFSAEQQTEASITDHAPVTPEGEESLSPQPNPNELPEKPENFFEYLVDQLKSASPRRAVLVNYLDKILIYRSSGLMDHEKIALYYLERAIENMNTRNRLVLVVLSDSRVPVEIYKNNPKVRLFEVPLPGFSERSRFFRLRASVCSDQELEMMADATSGMFLQQLEMVSSALQTKRSTNPLSARDIRETVIKIKIGVKKDYWSELNIVDLDKAIKRIGQDREEPKQDKTTVENQKAHAFDKVKGQDQALMKVLDILTLARAGMTGVDDGRASRPRGVLFFAGPSGVGKTFLAKRMAHFLFGSEDAFIRLDMSEYKEEHSVSKLIGSPPGYVGFESGGALTNAVRENPFSVILFDEIEKAHTKVLDVFLQILDNGRLTDSKGQPAFFSESIIVLTSNLGTRKTDSRGNPSREADDLSKIRSEIAGFERDQRIREHFVESVEDFFRFEISRPELLNRIGSRIVPFNFIDKDDVQLQIVKDHLKSFWIELGDKYRHRAFEFRSTDQLAEYIVMKYGEQLKDFGGRGISNTLVDVVNVPLAKQVLEAEYQERSGLCFLCDAINGEVRVSTS